MFQKSIYHGIVAVDVFLAATAERINRVVYEAERRAGLAFANALHAETAKAQRNASLMQSVAEVAKRDATQAAADAKAIAKTNTAQARRLEGDYA